MASINRIPSDRKEEVRRLLELAARVACLAQEMTTQYRQAIDLLAALLLTIGDGIGSTEEFCRLAELARASTWQPEAATEELSGMLTGMLQAFDVAATKGNHGSAGL